MYKVTKLNQILQLVLLLCFVFTTTANEDCSRFKLGPYCVNECEAPGVINEDGKTCYCDTEKCKF